MVDQELDCTQMACPMPIVRISQAIKAMEGGKRLVVRACDPAFESDIRAWVRNTGHVLVEFEAGEVCRAVIEKGPS
jgi:TusA-related sulfurtransferase